MRLDERLAAWALAWPWLLVGSSLGDSAVKVTKKTFWFPSFNDSKSEIECNWLIPRLETYISHVFFSVHLGAFVWLWSMPYKESYGRIRWLLSGIQESRAVELDVTRLAAMISPLIYEAAVMWTGTYLVFFLIMAALCISNLYMVPSLTLLIFITLQTTGRKPQAEILKAWSSRIDYDIYWVTVLRVCPLRLTFCQKYPAYKPTRRPNVLKRLLLSSGKAWKKKHERERENHHGFRRRPFPSWWHSFQFLSFTFDEETLRQVAPINPERIQVVWSVDWSGLGLVSVSEMLLHKDVELWSQLETLRIFWNMKPISAQLIPLQKGLSKGSVASKKVHSCWDITCPCQGKLTK